ncbi:hypothetical protein [Mucilaginibacter sp.]|uniref:hypothetical protein n=1 Tax=Mucilaginibacter sp. TaxID=1882438 RepID=UPI002637AC3D|nr:hypothetical protein [Mucilaginibacter sp.]MDB4926786.1 hypothetical protein [Mucilaginibacter sp.]
MGLIANIAFANTHTSPDGATDYADDVYINIIDAATGLPTDGNNVVITYLINENGVNTTRDITIAGQRSATIDAGIITQRTPDGVGGFTTTYSKTYTIINISNAPDPAPPVNSCDLLITNVDIDRSESAPGAGDAQITVHATSSYLPLQFSLDNITFQSSNIFTGITGGLKTVYVTDANSVGCAANLQVNIPVLSRLLISDPSATIGDNISRWNAAFNPVVFTYQRKDFEVISVISDSLTGNAKFIVNANLTGVLNDDLVYINTGSYKGTYKIKTDTVNSLILNTPYTTTATGYININRLRPYYKLLTDITYQDPETNQEKTIRSTNRPDNTGLIKADLSNFLQSIVRVKDESDFTKLNFRDDNLSASYQIAYAEDWDNNPQPDNWVTIADPYYVVYAAKQLAERYGGNLAAYVPFASVITGIPLARWITDFAEPVYSNGYPFDIGFIYSESLLGLNLYYELTLLDINRNPLSGQPLTNALLNDNGTWLFNEDGSKLIIANQTISNGPLSDQLGLNRLLINSNFPAVAYYFTITLKYDNENGPNTVTQTQTIRIDDAVDERSVYLRWIGLSGSWNYYRFVYNQEVSLDVQNAIIIKNYVSDWENQDSIEEVISKTAGQKMKVMAEDLSVADIKGLQSIKYSPKVQMLVNKNPVKWQTVVLNTATFSEYETLNGQAPFSVTFNLPSINIQTQ